MLDLFKCLPEAVVYPTLLPFLVPFAHSVTTVTWEPSLEMPTGFSISSFSPYFTSSYCCYPSSAVSFHQPQSIWIFSLLLHFFPPHLYSFQGAKYRWEEKPETLESAGVFYFNVTDNFRWCSVKSNHKRKGIQINICCFQFFHSQIQNVSSHFSFFVPSRNDIPRTQDVMQQSPLFISV